MATASRERPKEVIYPDSDGQPMGETPRHVRVILETFSVLDYHFVNDEQMFLAANMFVYYAKGEPLKHVSPDLFAVKGIAKNKVPERRNYKTWEEGGRGPDAILEATSKSTQDNDIKNKFEIYRDILKVKEYFLFDPYGEYLQPRLQGFRLQGSEYVAIKPVNGRLPSEILDLHLEVLNGALRLWDPKTKELIANWDEERRQGEEARRQAREAQDQAAQAQQHAEQEQQHAEQAQQRAERAQQEAEQAQQQVEQAQQQVEEAQQQAKRAQQQAEQAQQQAEHAQQQADRERIEREQEEQARKRAETELERTRLELENLRKQLPKE